MLSARCRLRTARDFSRVMRSGTRAARTHVVVHFAPRVGDGTAHVGFVVPKKVSGAVGRNLIKRRFRAIMAEALNQPTEHGLLAAEGDVVIRALAGAGEVPFTDLHHEVVSSLRTAQRRYFERDHQRSGRPHEPA
ncbi:ribonuclease P protein component [Micrococcales bacterium 31B]|nr:ribonuclease P protein component [Micrococcales bacterium 31B]